MSTISTGFSRSTTVFLRDYFRRSSKKEVDGKKVLLGLGANTKVAQYDKLL